MMLLLLLECLADRTSPKASNIHSKSKQCKAQLNSAQQCRPETNASVAFAHPLAGNKCRRSNKWCREVCACVYVCVCTTAPSTNTSARFKPHSFNAHPALATLTRAHQAKKKMDDVEHSLSIKKILYTYVCMSKCE